MTIEEAIEQIKILKAFTGYDEDSPIVQRIQEALDMAIKALEQQPCEDCISREAVLRLVEQYPNIIGNRCVGLMADIKHLPSVTPSYNSVKTELYHVIDEIIIRIEQTRDKDKLCEYPYNRCIKIIREVLGDD